LILPLIYLTYSIFFGAKAPANPWMLPGLEWRTAFAAADRKL
jgi:cytochrome c oxidase subunit 1